MKTVEEIYSFLCTLAPPETQLAFDNAGFLVGRRKAPVKRALLALDITDDVIAEAAEIEAELIVSHHPVIFHKLRSVSDAGWDDRALLLAEKGLAAICMHTNLDIAEGGVNDVLIARLGASCEGPLDSDHCGRVGTLPEEMPLREFMARCKTELNVAALRYHDAGHPVKRLAVMGGAGGDALEDVLENGCDTYVTADIKYHQFLDAAKMGINLIDADHFCTENPIIPVLADKLRAAFPDVEFRISQRHRAIISFF